MPTIAPDKDQNAAGSPRFEEQCYLLWNWSTFHKNNLKETYDNFTVLMGEPSSIINRLLSRRGIDRLFKLKPYEAAALVPKIRIFKSSEEGADQELMFSDHTTKSSIESITQTGFGRGDGIGIKSFDYDLQGGSKTGGPALVKKGVTKINFKFIFQNLEMLVQRSEGHPALLDLVTLPPKQTKKAVPKCAEGDEINISRLWDTKAFQMKVVYGWATPDGPLVGSELKAAIAGSATTLLVGYEKHDLDFKQDGNVELSITSNGYADSVMSDPGSDIFWLDQKRSETQDMKKADVEDNDAVLNEMEKELKEAKKAEEKANDDQSWGDHITDAFGYGSDANEAAEQKVDAIENQMSKGQEARDAAKSAYDNEAGQNKIYVYQRLLQALHSSGKIYYVDLTPEQVKAYEEESRLVLQNRQNAASGAPRLTPRGSGGTEQDLAAKNPELVEAAEKKIADGNETSGPEIKPQTANVEDTAIADNGKAIKEAIENNVKDPDKDLAKAMETHSKENLATTKVPAPNTRIFYLYYGDLLNIAFSVLRQNPAAANIRAMIGPIGFTDIRTNTKTIINLADVAISLNGFLEWFNNNVVGKGVTAYLLQDFVRDTIKDLIHEALGENCWESKGAPTPAPTVSVQPLVVPGTGPGGKEDRIPMGGRISVEDISSVDVRDLVPGAEDKDATGLHVYVYIYSYGWSSTDLKGDMIEDTKKGIYHLNIGNDSGLVKSMKFSKHGNPKIDASRATKQTCDMRHLQQQYKITIEMIGNSVFHPGQYIYVNPSTMGSGDPQSRAIITERLGLGGYYLVNKVSGDITSAGFNTTIEATREAGSNSARKATMAPTDGVSLTEPPVDAMPADMKLPSS